MTIIRLLAFFGAVGLGVAGLCLAQYPQTYHSGTATVPLYGMGFAQAQPPAAPAGEPPWVQRIEDKLNRLLKLVEDEAAAEKGPPAVGKAEAGAGDVLVSAAGKCVPCHVPDLPAKVGGGFVFFQKRDDGWDMVPPATGADWSRLNRKVVVRHDMPPPVGSPDNPNNVPPLTKEELAAFSKWLTENQPKK